MHIDPIREYQDHLQSAQEAEPRYDPCRAALATATKQGVPSVRFVLVKSADDSGFVFFTNYESRKAKELLANPHAALAFHWWSIGVQIRVEGTITRTSSAESDRYFQSRTKGSQLGAWASPQSQRIASRKELLREVEKIGSQFTNEIPRPPFWGGYKLHATQIEFWFNRDDRLHDRYLYERSQQGWTREILAP